MENLKRVQRKRTKGFKLPENTKCVNRGTKWGNPIKLDGDMIYVNASYRRTILDPWVYICQGDINDVIEIYKSLFNQSVWWNSDMRYWHEQFQKLDVPELKGKNLACFCPEGSPCHGDVLLKLANPEID